MSSPGPTDLKTFMRYMIRALQFKTGSKDVQHIWKKLFGGAFGVKALSVAHPDDLEALSKQIDYLPRGWTPDRYEIAIHGILRDFWLAHKEYEARNRKPRTEPLYERVAPGVWKKKQTNPHISEAMQRAMPQKVK